MTNELTTYLRSIESALRCGDATEHTHRPTLITLIESLALGIIATNERDRQSNTGVTDKIMKKKTLRIKSDNKCG